MIYYLTAARHADVMTAYLADLGKALADRIRILPYEQLFARLPVALPQATYILTSIGRPLGSYHPPSQSRQLVARLRRELIDRHGPGSVLNDPVASLRRFPLLRTLQERGINRFGAYRAGELPDLARFPLFLRMEGGTQWETIPLLRNRAEYESALAATASRDGLLAVEFCDTRDEKGIYRKYGAFVVGSRIVPRHLFFSRDWMVKIADLTDREQCAEEMAYLETNPHADALLNICRLANISYGRIDYAVHAGRLQIWEINTTPSLVGAPGPDNVVRRAAHQCFAAAFSSAMDAIDIGTAPAAMPSSGHQ